MPVLLLLLLDAALCCARNQPAAKPTTAHKIVCFISTHLLSRDLAPPLAATTLPALAGSLDEAASPRAALRPAHGAAAAGGGGAATLTAVATT
jgi:hypothetical protein